MPGTALLNERVLARALDVVSPEAVATPGEQIPEGALAGLAALIPCGRVHITACRRTAAMKPTDRALEVDWQGICYQVFPDGTPSSTASTGRP